MPCRNCASERLSVVSSKTSDRASIEILGGREHDGYLPDDMGIGGGDYIEFEYCLECGAIQGEFPLPHCALESEEDADEDA